MLLFSYFGPIGILSNWVHVLGQVQVLHSPMIRVLRLTNSNANLCASFPWIFKTFVGGRHYQFQYICFFLAIVCPSKKEKKKDFNKKCIFRRCACSCTCSQLFNRPLRYSHSHTYCISISAKKMFKKVLSNIFTATPVMMVRQ